MKICKWGVDAKSVVKICKWGNNDKKCHENRKSRSHESVISGTNRQNLASKWWLSLYFKYIHPVTWSNFPILAPNGQQEREISILSEILHYASNLSVWNRGKWMLRTTLHLAQFFTFFFLHPMMYFVHASMRACFFTEGEGYHMRMRTGHLPTKMDDAQDPHSPTLRTSHWGWAVIRWSNHKAPWYKQTPLYECKNVYLKALQKYENPNRNE